MAAERLDSGFHLPHPARQPDRALFDDADLQRWKAFEHAVEDHRRERLHGRARDTHVVDRSEVLDASVEVGRNWQSVLEVVRVDQIAGASYVKHDRNLGFLCDRPQRVESDVTR